MARLTTYLIDTLFTLLIPISITLHLLLAPYTKVEESFSLQATHDILVHGIPTSNTSDRLRATYDHFAFPGAVPRTFVGPLLLASFSEPFIRWVGFEHAQTVVRLVLGMLNALALGVLKRNLARAHGKGVGRWFAVLQASQFHVPFYASRTLGNMFAFGLTTWSLSLLLPTPTTTTTSSPSTTFRRQRLSITLLVFAAVIFRSEVAILLLTTSLYLLLAPETHLAILIPPFLVSFLMALLISVPLDTLLWQRWPLIWPELWGFYYNAVLGSASNWGTEPVWWYFTSALPRLLLNPLSYLVLIPIAWRADATARTTKKLVVPSLLFVAIYSLQPHKEARFIFYVVPALTAAASLGANYVFVRRGKSLLYQVTSLVLVASVLLSFAASLAMGLVSSLNYPGGEALAYLGGRGVEDVAHHLPPSQVTDPGVAEVVEVRVHADVLSCMTGVTLFGSNTGWPVAAGVDGNNDAVDGSSGEKRGLYRRLLVDKTEDPEVLADPEFWQRFDYVLAEDPDNTVKGGEWDEVAVVEGYGGVEVLRPGMEVEKEDKREVVGKGRIVADVRHKVRRLTGGWWVGPRMVPKIRVLRRVRRGRGRDGVGG
ncbi:alpha-1,6-mannosyltransferase subunit [Coniochaeta sp. 2T2.1]|nr:alpha-1,6-mannosyltransferase subunit [Coniochaeta sp. 2T2.1]